MENEIRNDNAAAPVADANSSEKYFTVGGSDGVELTLVARGIERAALATRIWDEDDSEDGIIGAGMMVDYFPGQPTLHTDTRLCDALLAAGCEVES
ncbi:MAG: hypothetical protein ABIJ96_05995 [Elusimicrobiota bacterium]